jgi:ComF family protein
MGIYTRISAIFTPKQTCILCEKLGKFCVCATCEIKLTKPQIRCLSCATKLPTTHLHKLSFCGACLAHSPYFSNTYVLYDYQDCATLIKQFKFQHQLCIGRYFAHKLYDEYLKIIKKNGEYDAIIPMPLNKKRLQSRGYNQAIELLALIQKNTDALIDTQNIKRVKHTRPLSRLKLSERRQEIQGAFITQPLSYQKVLLIDDVMSSASSMNELSKTLLKSGVGKCDVLVVARA